MEVSGSSPSQPSYPSEFKQGVELFEKSFHNMQTSKLDAQKAQYVKVMDESLQVMQDSASAMLNKHLLELKNTLSQDLHTYLAAPTDEHRKKVESDLDQLKHS
jgi:hypothetical protein